MPSVSRAQQKLMHAAANDPKVAKERGEEIPLPTEETPLSQEDTLNAE